MKVLKPLLPLACSIIATFSYSQNGGSIVTHFIKKGETISSIARQYHTKKDDILRLNNLSDNTVLHIGQKIIVPTGKGNTVSQPTVTTKTATVVKPAPNNNQYQIMPGDNLTKIAKQHHVTEQQLKDWNGLKNDNIKAGNYLTVSNINAAPKPIVKKEEKKAETEISPAKVDPIVKKVEPQPEQITKPIVQEKAPEKVETKETKTQVAETPKPTPAIVSTKNGEDFFKNEFSSTKNSVEGNSGIFKTIAGIQDKKYYVLLNNIESGKVVKISANNKFVYAKVLGSLPNIKEDNDLTLRISSAAANALGIGENKFIAKVEF